jgi:hypothetical protein
VNEPKKAWMAWETRPKRFRVRLFFSSATALRVPPLERFAPDVREKVGRIATVSRTRPDADRSRYLTRDCRAVKIGFDKRNRLVMRQCYN